MIILLRLAILLSLIFVSCRKDDDPVAGQQTDPVRALQAACQEGKTIRSVTPVKSGNGELSVVRFTDGSTVRVPVESGSVLPYLKINDSNFWMLSVDAGTHFSPLLDSGGSMVQAGGLYNVDVYSDNPSGNGHSVTALVNAAGKYVVNLVDPKTDKVSSSIVTCHTYDTKNIMKSIVVDKARAIVSLALQNGSVLDFKQEFVLPESISVLSSEAALTLGGTAEVEVQVTPAAAHVNLNDLSLSSTDHLTIRSVVRAEDQFGNLVKGRYRVTIKDKNSPSVYSDQVKIVLSSVYGDKSLQLSTDPVHISARELAGLPKVFIETPGGAAIVSKTDWLEDCTIRIVNEDEVEELNASASVRGRGNSTWSYPKKPYAVKFDSKTEVLGMPKHKRWVLLANWMDRTLLRNDVAFEMGRRIMDWAPRGEFVELYMNGKHQGNYYLCEQIKVDANRVNVDKEEGYILEFDTYGPYDEINYFYTSLKGLPVTIKEPDEDLITSWDHPGFLYIQDYVNGVESLLTSGASWEQIQEQIDVVSFIDWWLIHELSTNWEPLHPKSSYMHKDRDGKLKAGPVWDFDWGTFMPGQYWLGNQEAIWYVELFGYEEFKLALKTRWNEVKDPLDDIGNYIDLQAERLRQSDQVNFAKWPITTVVNGDESLTYDAAIKRMRQAFSHRMSVIDAYVAGL